MTESYGPLLLSDKTYSHNNITLTDITEGLLDPKNFLVKCNSNKGEYMGGCLFYRGDMMPSDVNEAILNVKKKRTIEFVDWVP